MRRLDLAGKCFGRLTVIADSGRSTNTKKAALHRVQCDCGKKLLVDSAHLTSGETVSCGCTRLEKLGVSLPGESNPKHKLTDDDVRSIRLMYHTGDWLQKELASHFNVNPSCISKVLLGTTWRHI